MTATPAGGLFQRPAVVSALLTGLALAVYSQVVGFEFLGYDDRFFVVENRAVRAGLSWATFKWALFSRFGFWFPLTRLSHLLDTSIWGMSPSGHHLTSLVLHTTSVVLVFQIFRRLTGSLGRAAVIAALFAVHPLGAETVSWISERKGVLCGTLFLSALYVYVGGDGPPKPKRIAATSALYLAALMAKPMALTLPGVLLLIDWWPLKSLGWRRVIEKVPMVVIAAAVSVVTAAAQEAVAATVDSTTFPLKVRIANALVATGDYLRLLFVPVGLSPFYPHPYDTLPDWRVAVAAVMLISVTAIFWFWRNARPHLLVGWLWWLGMLVPVIGLVQIGRWSMADHYMYLPMLGLLFALVTELGARLTPHVGLTVGAIVVAVFAFLAAMQSSYWHDTRTLFEHAAEVSPRTNWMAEMMLGELDAQKGDFASAEKRLRQSMQALDRDLPMRANVLAVLLRVLDRAPGGRAAEVAQLEARARTAPDDLIAQYEWGAALLAGARWVEAEAVFRALVAKYPDYLPARARLDEAVRAAKLRVRGAPAVPETPALP